MLFRSGNGHIDRNPDLEALVDMPVPGKTKRNMPIDTTAFRKRIRYALRNYEGWGDRTAESTLKSIIEIAGEFSAKGDWRSASANSIKLLQTFSLLC